MKSVQNTGAGGMTTLAEALRQLAAQPDIAGFLLAHGFRGRREDCFTCPVARYVQHETGADGADVITHEAMVWFNENYLREEFADVPESVARFIQEFDAAEYPELER